MRKTIPVNACFVHAKIVYKCQDSKGSFGCDKCAFRVDHGELYLVCDAPHFIRCSALLRSDDLDVYFEEVGELFDYD